MSILVEIQSATADGKIGQNGGCTMGSTVPNLAKAITQEQYVTMLLREQMRIAEFLATGALYTLFPLSEDAKGLQQLPMTIQLHCAGTCEKEQTFERYGSHGNSDRYWGGTVEYRCRNCNTKTQKYMYVWTEQGLTKVGQVPELQEPIDPRLKKALGDSATLYRKAVRSRSFGFGIGAVSYLRRIVEDKTDALMDLLREEKWDSWDAASREQFEQARATFQYQQKIEYAAEKILPPAAFVNGRDSFAALHDVTSSGLHGKSEGECITIFDRCNLIFTRTFQMPYEHKREREEFARELMALKR